MVNTFREAMDVEDKVEEDMARVFGRLPITWGTIDHEQENLV